MIEYSQPKKGQEGIHFFLAERGIGMEKKAKRPCMLIVDDVEINRTILEEYFKDDYEILHAEDGQQALDVIEENNIDIILLDLVMPVMDGIEVLTRLKQNSRFASIPVVATTARNEVESEAKMMELGAADFITKPYHPTIVRCRVRNVMARLENEWRKIEQAEQKVQLLELSRKIGEDPLTHLYNREKFCTAAAELMQKNSDVKYAIVYLDISHFKVVNDLCDIETGNLVLKTAGACFAHYTKDRGICARLEADHFAICMPLDELKMDELISAVDEDMQMLVLPHTILFYAGVLPVENVFLPVDQMCDRAHMALSTVKDNYRKRYAFYDDKMRERMMDEQMILREMEYAIEQKQFTIYLQPIYSTVKQCDTSAEALVRWTHPTEGMISPDRFIPLFERNGFIARLDHYVWEEVCRLLADERAKLGRVVPVSVNVSRLDFYDENLLDFFLGLMKKYDLEPWMIKLEVTESAYTDNPQQIMKTMKRFQEAGFKFLMDDFGSGYSSLSMLRNLPVNILKIDMKFVQEIVTSYRAAKIMEHIVQLAHDIKMDVVIEGVETKEQVEFLQDIGCDEIQGYYFSRPLPRDEYLERLAESPIAGESMELSEGW